MTEQTAEPGRTIANRYRIVERIGSGAFAVTYRAVDMRLDRPVALKILRSELANDGQFTARFLREAQTAAAITSQFTVQIFDVGQAGDSPYIAMEFIDGQSLRDRLDAQGRLAVNESVSLIGQVLKGLESIHARGVIHRDLKPENVLVGSDGNARIADFGIAMAADDVRLTTTGTTFGTAAYMAPEQGRGEPVTSATDIYAAGVMLFEMLTGRLPFPASTVVAMLLAHQSAPAPSLTSVDPRLGDQRILDHVIQQALEKDPRRRFQSARTMAIALDQQAIPINGQATVRSTARIERTLPIDVRPVHRQPPPQRPATEKGSGGGGMFWILILALMIGLGAAGVYAYDSYYSVPDDGENPAVFATRTPDVINVETEAVNEPEPTSISEQPPIEEIDQTEPPIEIIEEPTGTQIELFEETPDDGGEPTEPVLIDPVGSPEN